MVLPSLRLDDLFVKEGPLQLIKRSSTSSKPVSIALKLEMLSKCLQHVKIEDAVTLVIQQDVIVVKITSSVKSRTKSYRLVLLNAIQGIRKARTSLFIGADRIVVPDMTHNTGLLLPGSLFTEIFSALKGFSEKVTISFSTAAVVFESSDANLSAKVELNDEPRGQVHVLCKKPVSRDFKLPSLSTVGKIISVAEVKECLIQLGDDAPLSISLDLGDDIGGIEIFLAPLASVD
ncbi:hypothetical protein Pelo_6562 [Pelomyxa schiedti]|nr:hypothetical protein Pelo_6562 [Pelomyxa schiedti]